MSYTNLRSDYQSRSACSGWRFCVEYQMKFSAQCPYWIGHKDVKNRILGDLLFEKWHKRPKSAYKLYWRTHPTEYEAANARYKKRITK